MKAKHIMWIGVAGIGGYLLYKFWNTAQGALKPVGNLIGDAVAWVTLPGPIKATYNFIMPTGERINGTGISLQSKGSGSPEFTYNGIRYVVTARDPLSNDYMTVYANLNQIPLS